MSKTKNAIIAPTLLPARRRGLVQVTSTTSELSLAECKIYVIPHVRVGSARCGAAREGTGLVGVAGRAVRGHACRYLHPAGYSGSTGRQSVESQQCLRVQLSADIKALDLFNSGTVHMNSKYYTYSNDVVCDRNTSVYSLGYTAVYYVQEELIMRFQ